MPQNDTNKKKELMQKACKLCDSSLCEVKTACILVKGDVIVSSSWNRPERHAEITALQEASLQSNDKNDYVLYTTRFPCPECSVIIANSGIKRVIYMSDHFTSNNAGRAYLESFEVTLENIPEVDVWRE